MSDPIQPATPVTAAPAPVAAPVLASKTSVPFGQYLIDNIPNHLKVLGIVVVIAASVIAFNMIRDLKAELRTQQQVTATLSQKFQQVGSAAISGNSTTTAPAVNQQAADVFGPALVALMQQQGAQINSLTTAIGLTQSQVTALAAQKVTVFTPMQQSVTTGQLTGYRIDESRTGAPPLSSVNLFYDPAQHDPSKAFTGTTWTHNQEKFSASVGDWVKNKDGGMRTTLKLSRTVSKPDPTDPTKLVQVGSEDIPITGSDTVYTPKGLLVGTPTVFPRWTLGVGLSKTVNSSGTVLDTSGVSVFGSIDYRLTNRYGVFMGTANNGILGGISIRLDSK